MSCVITAIHSVLPRTPANVFFPFLGSGFLCEAKVPYYARSDDGLPSYSSDFSSWPENPLLEWLASDPRNTVAMIPPRLPRKISVGCFVVVHVCILSVSQKEISSSRRILLRLFGCHEVDLLNTLALNSKRLQEIGCRKSVAELPLR